MEKNAQHVMPGGPETEKRVRLHGIPFISMCDEDGFDPARDVANSEKHNPPLAFGDWIFEDGNHLIIPSIGKWTVRSDSGGGCRRIGQHPDMVAKAVA
jgi:hypothetical protein